MIWGLEWTERAVADMDHLDRPTRKRVFSALDRLTVNPGGADIKKLAGGGDEWRLRVGRWRVRFRFVKRSRTINVLRVLLRGPATYRDL